MKIAFVGDREYYNNIFDIGYLNTICSNINYYTFDDTKKIYKDVIGNEIDLIIFPEIYKRAPKIISNIFILIDELKKISNVRMICTDVYFPNRGSIEDEILKRKDMIILSDSYIDASTLYVDTIDRSIDIPMLGVLNFDMLHFHQINGNPTLKEFVINQYPEFTNRNYDVMYKMGKPNPIRLLIALLLIKHNLNNHYTNLSFSTENSIHTYDDIELSLYHQSFNKIIDEYGLEKAGNKLLIGSYLGSTYSKTKLNFGKRQPQYNVDFNSYAEIYTESVTSDLAKIKEYPSVVAFTEKTFNNFFDFKIPLPIDTKTNIDYLKNIGFEFPIEPCYMDSDDDMDSMYIKLNKWMKELKKYDFKQLWNDWFYNSPFDSPLHNNHKLILEFMQTRNPNTGLMYSKPQYISTYKLLEKVSPPSLNDYINWDRQTYLFLKDKKLL
jgi:hypothetical protein